VFGGLELEKNIWKLDAGHSFANYHLRKITMCLSFIVICRKMLQYIKMKTTVTNFFRGFQDIIKKDKTIKVKCLMCWIGSLSPITHQQGMFKNVFTR
jgi:hypothetical protein